MEISSFTISADKTKLELKILDATDVSILRFWTQNTYKNFGELIDLSSKLTGASTQNIEITLTDIEEPYFDGIYFIEAEDSDETAVSFVGEFRRYRECMMNKLSHLNICDSCNDTIENTVINTDALLRALEHAMEERFIDEMLNFTKMLDKLCSDDCKTCGQYGNIQDIVTDNANYDPITVKIDGGELTN
jgi:hypothetical protein